MVNLPGPLWAGLFLHALTDVRGKILFHDRDIRLGTRPLQHDVLTQTRPAIGQFLVRPSKADHRPGQLHLVHGPFGRLDLGQSPMRGFLAPHLRRPPRAGLEGAVERHRLDGIALDAAKLSILETNSQTV